MGAKRSISQEKIWMKYYDQKVVDTPLPKCKAYTHLKESNADRLDSNALYYYGAHITFRQLFDKIDAAANAFAALGVKQGDVVSFLAVAVPECIAAIYGLNKLGATANTIDPRMDIDSIRRMVKESGSSILVTIDVAFPKVDKIMADIDQEHIVVLSPASSLPFIKKCLMKLLSKAKVPYGENGVIGWSDFIANGEGTVATEGEYIGDAIVAVAYTGGTTGFPKGVMLTNDSVNAVSFNFRHAGLDYAPGDRFLGIIPVFTSYGFVCGMHMPLTLGCELAPIPKFVPAEIGKLVKKVRPNHMIATPAFYEILMNSKEMRNFDMSFLTTMGSGGDTMVEGLEGKLHQFMKEHNMKYPLAQGYGMSELSAAASFCVNDIYKPSSVGIPSVGTIVSIFDSETGEELSYGELGEICVTGASMMKGYYKREEETANVMRLHDDGQVWVHSGDLGYMDEDGFIFIKGRVKRMITRFDGHKVFPVNLENMVSEHPAVHSCSVIGVKDREHSQGEYPMVIVELLPDTDRDAVCSEIFHDCNVRSEERGRPVAVIAIDEIPLTGAMKNDFKTLEKQFGDFDYTKWSPAEQDV
ncbi:MAG: acyl--CoA ligase [Ruminococcaceae bacterium]|nr:acyl--CoA ligase [Oscillospiraceae bacterium]